MSTCSREDAKRVSPAAASAGSATPSAPAPAAAAPATAGLFAASNSTGMTSPVGVSRSDISGRSIADLKPVIVEKIHEFVRPSHRGGPVTLAMAAPVDGAAWTANSSATGRSHMHSPIGARSFSDLQVAARGTAATPGSAPGAAATLPPHMGSLLSTVESHGSALLQPPSGGLASKAAVPPPGFGREVWSYEKGLMRSAYAAEAPIAAAPVLSVRPRCVPPAPFTLTPHIIDVELPLSTLRVTLEQALRDANVDYEYSDAKWKAKCYAYRTRGQCQFVLRIFAASPAPPAPAGFSGAPPRESFLLELQKRRGCCNTFRQSLDRLIARFGCLQLLPADCPAATRLRALYAASAAVPWALLPRSPSAEGAPGVDASPASPDAASPSVAAAGGAGLTTTGEGAGGETSFPPPPLPAGVLALLEAKRDVASLLRRAASAGAFDGDFPAAPTSSFSFSASSSSSPALPSLLSPEHAAAVAGAVEGGIDALEAQGDLAAVAAGGSEADDEAVEQRGFGPDGTPAAASHGHGDSPRGSLRPDADGAAASAGAGGSGAGAGASAAAVVAALASLTDGIDSKFEDVCLPAAQALSLLSASRRVRCALGEACAAFNEASVAASRGASPPALASPGVAAPPAAVGAGEATPAAGGACASASASVPMDAAQLAVRLVGTLLFNAADPNGSPECRTACALALANFARARGVADALMTFTAPQVLLDAAAAVHICARAACLRRQLLRAAWHVISTSAAHARLALVLDCRRRAGILASSPLHTGLEPGFDALIHRIAGRLNHEHALEAAVAAAAAAPVHVVANAGASSVASSSGDSDGSARSAVPGVLVGSNALAGALASGAGPAPAVAGDHHADAEHRD